MEYAEVREDLTRLCRRIQYSQWNSLSHTRVAVLPSARCHGNRNRHAREPIDYFLAQDFSSPRWKDYWTPGLSPIW